MHSDGNSAALHSISAGDENRICLQEKTYDLI